MARPNGGGSSGTGGTHQNKATGIPVTREKELSGAAGERHGATLSLGFSPCPNDTFIFHALVHGLVPCGGLSFSERLEDVETLNGLALSGLLDVSKISYHLLGH